MIACSQWVSIDSRTFNEKKNLSCGHDVGFYVEQRETAKTHRSAVDHGSQPRRHDTLASFDGFYSEPDIGNASCTLAYDRIDFPIKWFSS